jgi:soluble lytic murein transglycosylase
VPIILALMISLLVVSCSHVSTKRDMASVGSEVSETETLEYLLKNQFSAKDVLKEEALPSIDPTQLQFKNHQSTASNKKERTHLSPRQIVKELKGQSFQKLNEINYSQVIKVADHFSAQELKDLANYLLGEKSCVAPDDVYFGFAAVLERKFSDSFFGQSSMDLYAKTVDCTVDVDLTVRSSYRLAILSILHSKCPDATVRLESLKNFNYPGFSSRANYWYNRCAVNKNESTSEAMNMFQRFPTSYHTILRMRDAKIDLKEIVFGKEKTPILLRSKVKPETNIYLQEIERTIDRPKFAKQFLKAYDDDVLNVLEPELLLYLGYLAHRLDDDLTAFKSISRAFLRKPELKTKAALMLLYPLRFFEDIKYFASKENIDPNLVLSLVRQESAFNPYAKSLVGARGLMQLMPRTAKHLDRSIKPSDLFEVRGNLSVGTQYLSFLLKKYDYNLVYTLAAYNAGHGQVDDWIKRYKTDNELIFMDVIPFQETREYVSSILRNYYWYQQINGDQSKSSILQRIGEKQDRVLLEHNNQNTATSSQSNGVGS